MIKSKRQKYPGPTLWQMFLERKAIYSNIPAYLNRLFEEYGDVVDLRLIRWRTPRPTWLVRHPDDIKYVLATNPLNYRKMGALRLDHDLFGEGILSSAPPLHAKQRKLIQPMFHRKSIAGFIETIKQSAQEHIESWQEGDEIELCNEMTQLTLKIVGRTLFGIDLTKDAREMGDAIFTVQQLLVRRMQRVLIPKWMPTPSNARYRKALQQVDCFVYDLIKSRRELKEQPSDLIGMLIDSRYEDGSAMDDRQMRDELVTFFMAGHETVSNALNWTFYLLSEDLKVEEDLYREWDDVLQGRLPGMDDFHELVFTEKVLAESMRVYPPVWIIGRAALDDDILPSGLKVRGGEEVIMPPYVLHRNPAYFSDPEKFDPWRWTPEFKKSLPTGVYLPFGIGPRYCIGEQFARCEATIIMAAIGQKFRLRMLPGQVVEPDAMITMRPRNGLSMKLEAVQSRSS